MPGQGPSPIDVLMDSIHWRELPPADNGDAGELPSATHEGILEIGGASLRCFKLSDGQRIVDADDMHKLFAAGINDET